MLLGFENHENQFLHTRRTMDGLSNFIDMNYNICITHGNGPQVGNELLRMDLTNEQVPPLPLGVCVANTQGQMGYMIQQTLQNKLRDMNVDREVVTLVTQVIVDKNDKSIVLLFKFLWRCNDSVKGTIESLAPCIINT